MASLHVRLTSATSCGPSCCAAMHIACGGQSALPCCGGPGPGAGVGGKGGGGGGEGVVGGMQSRGMDATSGRMPQGVGGGSYHEVLGWSGSWKVTARVACTVSVSLAAVQWG